MAAPTLTDSARWPLVGREAELAAIASAREEPGCSGVVVTAAAGMGKSRLAREAQAAAGRAGALTDWVQATRSAASVPLGAFAGLLPDEVRADDPFELMRRSAEELRERAAGRPIVIAVDDAQLLDPVSATLVLHLATTGSAFVIATVRAGEPCPDAIVSLWKDVGARRMELDSLDEHAVARLIEAVLEAPVEQFALARAPHHSQGNPMYVRELVLSALDDGVLRLQRGMWRIATRSTRLSRTLIELVTQRMSGLSERERELLELLALGEPLRIAEAAALSDDAALDATEAKGLVTATLDSGGEVRLAHPIYGDALRAELPIVRARHLRLRLVETLRSRSPKTADDALRVARLSLDAGAEIPGEVLIDAARAATLTGDPTLGAGLAELAVAAGGSLPAMLLLARAHTVRKRFRDAEATLAAAEDLAAADDAGIDYLEQRTHVLFWGLNRVEEASALLERARSWSDDPAWSKRMEPLRLRFTARIADSVQALTDVLADDTLDPATRLRGERRLALGLFYAGRVGEARALAARLLPAIPLGDYSDALALGAWRLIEFETAEDWPALDDYMARVLREAVPARDNEAAGHGALGLGYTAYLGGRYRDARRWFAEAETHFERADTFGNLLHVRALRVGAEHFGGDDEAALEAHALLLETLAGNQPLFSQTSFIARAEGWALRSRGDLTGARRSFLASADALDAMPVYAAQLVYEALRAGAAASAAAERLGALGERCDARLTGVYLAHAAARAARDGAALLEVAERMAALGAGRYAMEAAVDAASAFVAAGREDSARRAAARARELHAPGHGAEFPRIDGLDSTAIALTARESQLVELASKGLTNAQIADRLVLSVRTVETHIYRAMQKLGVSDRRDL